MRVKYVEGITPQELEYAINLILEDFELSSFIYTIMKIDYLISDNGTSRAFITYTKEVKNGQE